MRNLARYPHFALEAVVSFTLACETKPESLEGNADTVKVVVAGFIHLAHPAASDETQDLEAVRYNLSYGKDWSVFGVAGIRPGALFVVAQDISNGPEQLPLVATLFLKPLQSLFQGELQGGVK
jgi:hypothetical protein